MEEGFKAYCNQNDINVKRIINDKFIWNPLDVYKVNNFSLNFDFYSISENDDRVKTNENRILFMDMISFKEYKCKLTMFFYLLS